MKLHYPQSFLKLILIGFSLVAFPLMLAIGNAALSMDRLANRSKKTVYDTVQATQNSRILIEQITTMERNARQFLILGDFSLFENYAQIHARFQKTAESLVQLPLDAEQRANLVRLIEMERGLFDMMSSYPQEAENSQAVARFMVMTQLAQSVLREANQMADRGVLEMQQTAGKAQRMLIGQALALIPLTLLVAILFTVLITRPINEVGDAIRRLGSGQFAKPINIEGPLDLEHLGKRLEWLRLRLIELEEQKSKFLRHVSHELKTPLTAIREGAELLTDEVGGKLSTQQAEIVRILKHNTLLLQKLIEDLLNYNVVQYRNAALNLETLELSEIIQTVVESHKLTVLSKRIKFDMELAQAAMIGDKDKLTLIVDNLVSNAIKFSPVGGEIKVRLARQADKLLLNMQDNGCGIDPQDKPRLFDPFYQGRKAAEGPVQGTGLGLAIAKEYVIAHQGTIEITDSEKGAHFQVSLPAQPQH